MWWLVTFPYLSTTPARGLFLVVYAQLAQEMNSSCRTRGGSGTVPPTIIIRPLRFRAANMVVTLTDSVTNGCWSHPGPRGQPSEWDVQLSSAGRSQLGWLSRDGDHVNVSPLGEVTHR